MKTKEKCESCGNIFPSIALEDVQIKVIGQLCLCASCMARYQANGEVEAELTCEDCAEEFYPDGVIAFEDESGCEFFRCLACAEKKGL